MSIDEPATDAHAALMDQIARLSAAVQEALRQHSEGLPLATVIGVLECIKLDAQAETTKRFYAAVGGMN